MTDTLPLISSTLPRDDRRLSYSYLGSRLFQLGAPPLYLHDRGRSKPMMVLGSTGQGKTEFLLSLAYSDAARRRPVFFIDGKCELRTMHKLASYCKLTDTPFYTFLPFQQGDRMTCSWSPFISKVLPISTIIEAFINAYADPSALLRRGGSGGGGGEGFYIETQRAACSSLMRALHNSGYQYNISDIRMLFEDIPLLQSIVSILKPQSFSAYGELLRLRKEEGDEFPKVMRRFVNHLAIFKHWAVNSYNPTITIEDVIEQRAVLYVGLPVDSQQVAMSAIGNILINLLKATASFIQSSTMGPVAPIGCFIDEAGNFIDAGLADWICKVRSSGFLLTLGLQTLAQLEGRRAGFADEIKANSPNVVMFNPQDADTANWFSTLTGLEARRSRRANLTAGNESGDGQLVGTETPMVHRDSVLKLNIGQCYYRPPEPSLHPPLLAASMLPDPSKNNPLLRHRRDNQSPPPSRKGLFLSAKSQAIPKA